MVNCKDFGFKETDSEERSRGDSPITVENYPKPVNKFKLVYQTFNQSVEEVYFWLLATLREDMGLHEVKKITDIFTSSEQSAFWGQAQQRLSIQQGQVSNYLATIGKLTKELFQIVRELKILDERLELYEQSNKAIELVSNVFNRKLSQSAEIVLRSYWVDLKDGGVKSPGSVYGLSSTLGYTTLPDLFFSAPPMKNLEVDDYVEKLKFNTKVQDVLKRKLKAFIVWKEHTYQEITARRGFTIKFLRQHYNSIQLYIEWIKPYLRNVKRLSQNFTRTESEDLIGAFEGSFTEIEIVLKKKAVGDYYAVVVMSILFRTAPHMEFHQDGYQHKGPVHVGRSEIVMRGYTWTKEDFDNYVRMREAETFDMLGDIDQSLKAAVEALGEDLRKYLKDKGEKFPEDVKKAEDEKRKVEDSLRISKLKGAAEPFTALFSGFAEIFRAFVPKAEKKKDAKSEWAKDKDRDKSVGVVRTAMWPAYKNFKKAHKMITW
jgi:hypothetical protein